MIVSITDNETGETRNSEWTDDSWFGDFIWSEGNFAFACDCNRGSFFAEAAGEDVSVLTDDEDAERFPCGEARFHVKITATNGDLLYEDD